MRRSRSPLSQRLPWAAGVVVLLVLACAPRSAVSLKVVREGDSPRDATVTIDEQFVGMLGVVAASGVKLPAGKHRVTVERQGYFPWDQLIESDGSPIRLRVNMVRIPD